MANCSFIFLNFVLSLWTVAGEIIRRLQLRVYLKENGMSETVNSFHAATAAVGDGGGDAMSP